MEVDTVGACFTNNICIVSIDAVREAGVDARLSLEVGDKVILGVFRNEAFAFFIIFNACLPLPNVRALEFIELVISIAGIFELDS